MKPAVDELRQMFRLSDDGSLTWLRVSKFHNDLIGCKAGAEMPNQRNDKSYWAVQINGRKVKRAHIVFCLTHGRWPIHQIDHINGNSLDDRPANLREATAMQNAWNHKTRAKESPLPMGVRQAKSGRYVARIRVSNKAYTIGTFDTPELAAASYQEARRVHFGEFA